jgi:hypothetical protein
MNLPGNTRMAVIYGVFVVLSALMAFLLFKFLPSSAEAEGQLAGLAFKAGGAIAGFLASFWLLHLAYSQHTLPARLAITGNVLDEQERPVKGATVWVDGVDRRKSSDDTGWFSIEVDNQPEWTVRAEKAGATGNLTLDANAIHRPARIRLKKKAP